MSASLSRRHLLAAAAAVPAAAALGAPAWAASATSPPGHRGVNNVVGPMPRPARIENDPELEHQFDVEFDNSVGGAVTHVALDGTRTKLGNVQRPATASVKANDGFWASKYSRALDGTPGHALAVSVYVLRFKVGPGAKYDPHDQRAWTTSLVNVRPDRFHGADHGKWLADTIYTDIEGGTSIFGGGASPAVGSPLKYLDEASGKWRPIHKYFEDDFTRPVPRHLRMSVYKPVTQYGSPTFVEFENWAAGDEVAGRVNENNGRILVGYPGGVVRHVADVVQRVRGSGRFGGTEFAEIGQMDTNHPGALTFSTSPRTGFSWDPNVRGGFQIVPANHVKYLSNDLGQNSFIDKPQWLIVGPVGGTAATLRDTRYLIDGQLSFTPGWEGVAPLFGLYMRTHMRFELSKDYGATWEQSPNLVGVTEPPASPVNTWTNIRVNMNYPAGP
ncbi:hypothetical protein [Sinosporangium siamense]|uniref:Tat pathway signal sequence domain protein n=1 Tax=Sinosporangium siamense TaxID=1367973 RepID=A0A919RCW1_9ACTN|nr:hypothetical protein [Sinosporangium siamense]GII91573.1 hypothetical protein Ssi02_18040 [Sinosporangium siamense]